MLTTTQFLMLTEKYQVRFLTNNLSSLDELLVFVELIQMQGLTISYEHVIIVAIGIWKERLSIEEDIESEYSSYLDDEQLKQLNEKKDKKEETLRKILGITLRMKLTQSFSENYDIATKDIVEIKKSIQVGNTSDTKKDSRRSRKKTKSRQHQNPGKQRKRGTTRKHLQNDDIRLSSGCITRATRASFIALAA